MAALSDEQRRFLKEQNIPLSIVYDASGLSRASYQSIMRDLGMEFAYGVTPCKRSGHSLRTRAGDCIQCDTSKIAYQLRHNESGFVYVAYSRSAKLLKIGVANNIQERLRNLNSQGYGGIKDWEMAFYKEYSEAGKVEMQVHNLLAQYQTVKTYFKTGSHVECRELFNCDVGIAVNFIKNM